MAAELFTCYPLLLDSCRFLLLQLEELVLSLAKEFGALAEVLAKRLVLERQFVQLFLHLVVLSSCKVSILVPLENIDLSLKLVIFSIKEINLAL